MKNLVKKIAYAGIILTLLAAAFAGCPNPDDSTSPIITDDTKPVTDIQFRINGMTSGAAFPMKLEDEAALTGNVLPASGANMASERGYSFWIHDNEPEESDGMVITFVDGSGVPLAGGANTIGSGGKTTPVVLEAGGSVILKANALGTAKITIESAGEKADGNKASQTVTFTVAENPDLLVVGMWHYKQGEDPVLTKDTSSMIDSGYYKITNTSGNIDSSAWTNTNDILYFNYPFKFEDNGVFSISARIKITGRSGSGGTNSGVIPALFSDPAVYPHPLFYGVRLASNGQRREYRSTDATGQSAAGSSMGIIESGDSATAEEGFWDQEFIYTVERTTGTTLKVYAYYPNANLLDSSAPAPIAEFTRSSSVYEGLISNIGEFYLGFIVSNVSAEISNIIIMADTVDNDAFTTAGAKKVYTELTSTAARTVEVRDIRITGEGSGFISSYTGSLDFFPADGHTLAARVVPLSAADKTILWSVDPVSANFILDDKHDGTATNKITAGGTYTVTASGANSKTASYVYEILEGAMDVDAINISGPASAVKDFQIILKGEVSTVGAEKELAWSVKAGSEAYLEIIGSSFDPATGINKVTVKGLTLGTGYIVASATDSSGFTEEKAVEVVTQEGATILWDFSSDDFAFGTTNHANNTGPYTPDTYAEDKNTVRDLTFVLDLASGTAAAFGLSAQGTYAFSDGQSFTKRITQNNAGGLTRAIKFPVPGDCTVIIYAASGGSGRTIVLTDGETDGYIKNDKEPAATGSTGDFVSYAYEGDATNLYVYSSGGNNYYFGIKLVLPGDAPIPSNLIWEWKTGDSIVSTGKTNGISTRVTGGGSAMEITGGNMQMGTARFVVGANNTTTLTTSTYDKNAELDLSKKFKITVTYTAATAAGNFWVYIYSDAGGSGGGPVICKTFGGSSTNSDQRLLALSPPAATGGTATVTIDPSIDLVLRTEFTAANADLTLTDVLKTATLQFRCDSGCTSFIVSNILIEYVD